ncbi:MAG: dicarboxylate/amino acid:cation symporter [Planctomycetota bacterium]
MGDSNKRGLALHWQILIGLASGVLVGAIVNLAWTDATWNSLGVADPAPYLAGGKAAAASAAEGAANEGAGAVAWAARFARHANGFVGDLFLRALRFIAVPIVLFSLIVGVSSLRDTAKLGRIGGKTIGIYLATTAVAISVGLLLANLVGPGRGFDGGLRDRLQASGAADATEKVVGAQERGDVTGWDTLLNLVPTNPFEAMAEGNTLQVVVVALLVGFSLTLIPQVKARAVTDVCDALTEVVIRIVHLVLKIAPYAVFALIAKVVADLGVEVLANLTKYVLTVVFGLGLMMFGVYPLALKLLTRQRVGYGRFFAAISPAQLLAFSSSSSGATLPVTMDCLENRLGASEQVTSFVAPIGATINMDGTALYQGVAAAFIAQLYGMDLTLAQQLQIVLTATLASVGTAAVPGVGIVMLVIVLEAVGIPLEGIAVILGVDRILDMCRTACNVTGDCMVTAVVAGSEGQLRSVDELAGGASSESEPPAPEPSASDASGEPSPCGDGDEAAG